MSTSDTSSPAAQLVIVPHVSSSNIYEKLRDGPVGVSVCTAPLYGHGRMSEALPGREIPDDANGTIGTHSVVVYGNTASGDFLLADPWRGLTQVTRDASDLRHDRCRDRVRLPVHGVLEAQLIRRPTVRADLFVVQSVRDIGHGGHNCRLVQRW